MEEPFAPSNLDFLSGGGEMGERIRNFDWSKTPLGIPETWESSLRTCVRIMLTSPQPMFVWWGDAFINIYNDAYSVVLGGKHPEALGISGKIAWIEIWDEIRERVKIVFEKNEGTFDEALLLIMNRHGYDEETYFKFSYNPIPGTKKTTAGMFGVCTEETQGMLNERALHTLRKLDAIIYADKSPDIIYHNVAEALSNNNKDFPFAIVYKITGDENTVAVAATTGIDKSQYVFPDIIDITNPTAITKDFCESFRKNKMIVSEIKVDDLTLPTGAWKIAPHQFIHIPISPAGGTNPYCIISAALNPYRKFDENYLQFCQLIGNRVSIEINRMLSLEIKDRVLRDLYSILDELPFAVAVLKGEAFTIEYINKYNLNIFQEKKENIIGKPLFEARPDIKESVEHIHQGIYKTGKRFAVNEAPVIIINNEKAETRYFNAIMDPMFDETGKIVGQLSTSIDVTEQVLARKKVEESESQLKLITDALPVLISYIDKNGCYGFNNKAYETWFGYSNKEITGKPLKDVLGEAAYLNLKPKIDEVLSGQPVHFEMSLPYKDAGTRFVIADYIPHFGTNNKVLGFFGLVNDVTAIKKAEALNFQLASIVQSSADAIVSKTTEGIVTSWNAGAEKIFGYTAEEMIGKLVTKIIPRDRLDEEPCIIKKISEGQMVNHFITKRLTKEGKLIDISLTISPIKDSEGKIIGASKIARDITDDIKVRKKIEESEQQFNILANNIQNLAWIADNKGWIYWYNQRWYDYTGTTFEEMEGWGWQKVHHPDHVAHVVEISKKLWKTNVPFEQIFSLRRYDGAYRRFLTRGVPILDKHGRTLSWIGTNTDIEEQKTFTERLEAKVQERTVQLNVANQNLEEKNIELKKINKELEAFNYISSHDLQEPLRKIQTFAGRIIATEKDKLSDNAKEYFRRMQHSATRMQTLLQDLLAFSRISASERIFELTDHNIIVEEVIEEFKETIEVKKAILTTDELCASNINPFQFRQLMHNLIGNALKFSKPDLPPRILIRSEIAAGKELNTENLLPENKYCHISVADNGIGFDKKFTEKIFQVFQRLHGNDAYAGTGIGLAIVKKIVENHNGIITAESEPGKGTTFNIYLPV